MRIFKYLKKLFSNIFGKDEPKEIEVPPEVTTPTTGGTVVVPPINTVPERELDLINDGNPRNPDHTFLFDNLVIDEDRVEEAKQIAKKIVANFSRYSIVTTLTGVPEWFIGICHYRESTLNFNRVLHNGELLTNVNKYGTRLVPKGRGKGKMWSWEDAAVDAMKLKNYHTRTDWSLKNVLPTLEAWNGLGYRKRVGDKGAIEYSPFIVAGSEWHDETSKYVKDGKYDKNAKELQLGVFVILKAMEDYEGIKLH